MTANVRENFVRLSSHAVGPENSSTNHSRRTGGYLYIRSHFRGDDLGSNSVVNSSAGVGSVDVELRTFRISEYYQLMRSKESYIVLNALLPQIFKDNVS
jgi:hypothetical protein